MLSLKGDKNDRKVALIEGGKNDGKYIYLIDNEDDNKIHNRKIIIGEDFFRKRGFKQPEQIKKIKIAIHNKKEPTDKKIINIYNETMKYINDKMKKEIIIEDGKIRPLPDKIKMGEQNHRCLVSGPSGSGKSTYVGNYLKYYKKKYPNKEIYIFSNVKHDKILDKYNPMRIYLCRELITDPLHVDELENSLCIFDDIDTLKDKYLKDALVNLRARLLEMGRHHNIDIFCANHLLFNYKTTRELLNESNAVTLFHKSGSKYHITNYLKKQIGANKEIINKIFNLPGRYFTVSCVHPQYILSEKVIFLLN